MDRRLAVVGTAFLMLGFGVEAQDLQDRVLHTIVHRDPSGVHL